MAKVNELMQVCDELEERLSTKRGTHSAFAEAAVAAISNEHTGGQAEQPPKRSASPAMEHMRADSHVDSHGNELRWKTADGRG